MKKSELRHIIQSVIKEHITNPPHTTNPNHAHLNYTPKYRCGSCDTPCSQQVIDNNPLTTNSNLQFGSGGTINSICVYDSPQECHAGCEGSSGFGDFMKRCHYDKLGKPMGCKTCTHYEAHYDPNLRWLPSQGEVDPFIRCTPNNHLHNGIYGCQCADKIPTHTISKTKK